MKKFPPSNDLILERMNDDPETREAIEMWTSLTNKFGRRDSYDRELGDRLEYILNFHCITPENVEEEGPDQEEQDEC